jgi:multiple sugar transport system substrate-binding protein
MYRSGLLRTLALSTVVTLVLILMVGPGHSRASAPASHARAGVTISVVYSQTYLFDDTPHAIAWWKSIKQQFEKRYPGDHLTLIPEQGTDEDEVSKINLMLRSPATTPDVLSIPTAPVGAMAAAGYLEPLNSYVAKWAKWKDIPPAIQQESAVNGQIYGVNTGNNDCGLLYDRPYFTKAGIAVPWKPRTWADILSAARKIKKNLPKVHPFFMMAGKANGAITVLQGDGNLLVGARQPTIFDSKTGKWVVRSSGLLDLFGFLHTMSAEGLLGPTGDVFTPQIFTPLLNNWLPHQKYAMAVACNWMPAVWLAPSLGTGGINWAQGRNVWGAVAMPTEFGQKPGIATVIGGWTFSMAASSKHKDMAWNLIKLMSESNNIITLGNQSGVIPPAKSDGDSPAYVNFLVPYNAIFNSFLPAGTTLPSGAAYPKWAEAMNDTTGAIMQNPGMTGQQAQDMFAQEATQLIGPDQVETLK